MVIIPKIKKTINKFVLGEEGKISKKSLIIVGPIILLSALPAAFADHGSCEWEIKAVAGSEDDYDLFKDKVFWFDVEDTEFDSPTNSDPPEISCDKPYAWQHDDGCDDSHTTAHANFKLEGPYGVAHGNEASGHRSHDSCYSHHGNKSVEVTVNLVDGKHVNSIYLEKSGTKLIGKHDHDFEDLKITGWQKASRHDNS